MDSVRARALAVANRLADDADRLRHLPDGPDGQVHSLFAGLYLQTTTRWLDTLIAARAPEAALDVVYHFYLLWDAGVVQPRGAPLSQVPDPWRRYHRLARRLTMGAPISAHLLLLSLAARAHVRHDLGPAMRAAVTMERRRTGRATDLQSIWPYIVGPMSQKVFADAALAFVHQHRRERRGWRRAVLTVYVVGLHVLRPVWTRVLQGWRAAAFRDAERAEAGR